MRISVGLLFWTGWFTLISNAANFTPSEAGKIGQAVGLLLEKQHFSQAALDDRISALFLNNYLNDLDHDHLIFLQSDYTEFAARYEHTLDEAISKADATPAFIIYDRYLQRLKECREFVDELVGENSALEGKASVPRDLDKASWPKNAAEAKTLWRMRIQAEVIKAERSSVQLDRPGKSISLRYARLEANMRAYNRGDILQVYLSALTHAYDPHSRYMLPTEPQRFDSARGLSGIGAMLETKDGFVSVRGLVPGAPAAMGGELRANDRILAVAQGEEDAVAVVEMSLGKVVELTRGTRGTEVRLTVARANGSDGGSQKIIKIVRDEIEIKKVEQHDNAWIVEKIDGQGQIHRIGALGVPMFYDNCAGDAERIVRKLKKEKVEGILLDLRGTENRGLDQAIRLCGLFIKGGAPVVQLGDRIKGVRVLTNSSVNVVYGGPLVVLVDKLGASQSEIVAAALQDHGRALLVGDQRTGGKGTQQTIIGLEEYCSVERPGKVMLTTTKVYRISGRTIHKQGVNPDIILPSFFDPLTSTESDNEIAASSDVIARPKYTSLNLVQPFLPRLHKIMGDRNSSGLDFNDFAENAQSARRKQAEKTVSVDEATHFEKIDQTEVRAREQIRRQAAQDKLFAIRFDTGKGKQSAVPSESLQTTSEDADDQLAMEEIGSRRTLDARLTEGLRILEDYVQLRNKLD